MKKFVMTVLSVSVFFLGLGALVDKSTAHFKSDEKAVELIRKARQAIGGDSSIANVQSMLVVGNTTKTIKGDGVERIVQGETEIAMELPDKLMKMTKLGAGDGAGSPDVRKEINVIVTDDGKGAANWTEKGNNGSPVKRIIIKKNDGTVQELNGADAEKVTVTDSGTPANGSRKIIMKKADGTTELIDGAAPDKMVVRTDGGNNPEIVVRSVDADGHHEKMRHNEMLRLSLGLLLSAPEGLDVSYTYGGESSIDGTLCNLVVAEAGGLSYKLFLDASSNLPVMMTYKGMEMPTIVRFKSDAPASGDGEKDNLVFVRKMDGPPPGTVEYAVKFSDYRSTGGVLLPYKWVQTVGGRVDETFDVTSYDINSPNIADKFKNEKVMVRTKKADSQ